MQLTGPNPSVPGIACPQSQLTPVPGRGSSNSWSYRWYQSLRRYDSCADGASKNRSAMRPKVPTEIGDR